MSMGLKCTYKQLEEQNMLRPFELLYIEDMGILGIVNADRKPQLLVDVITYDSLEKFPKEELPKINLYRDGSTGLVYFYDRAKKGYSNIEMDIHGKFLFKI